MSQASATGTDEQFAARELVRSWAAGSNAVAAAREIEQGDPGSVARAVRGSGPARHLRRGDARRVRWGRRHRRRPVRDGRRGRRRDGPRSDRHHGALPRWSSRVRRPTCWRRWRPASAPPGVALTADLQYDERPGIRHRRVRAGRRSRGGAAAARRLRTSSCSSTPPPTVSRSNR